MTHHKGSVRVGALNQWRGFVYVAIFLIGLILAIVYVSNLPKKLNTDPTTKNVYSSVKSFAASYTVSRTYTSKNNIVINNLWRNSDTISNGDNSSCAVSNGKPYCWGYNEYGQLGDGTTTQRTTPVAVNTSGVLSGKTVTAISVGSSSACAVADGQAYCWGQNTYGQLGDGTTTQSTTPVAVSTAGVLSGRTVTAVAVGKVQGGNAHACAIADGRAFCWGGGTSGYTLLGNGTANSSTTPVAVTTSGALSGKAVTSISTGSLATCVIADGRAFCWGFNGNGRLGTGDNLSQSNPTAVKAISGDPLYNKAVTDITLGNATGCVVADGKAYCWGFNSNGQLGNNSTTSTNAPVAVKADVSGDPLYGKVVTAISTGYHHTCAVAGGRAYCWGLNSYGQLGDGTTNQSTVPITVDTSGVISGKYVSSITARAFTPFTCAVANGRSYCWGRNNAGQLGEGTTVDKSVPYRVSDSFY